MTKSNRRRTVTSIHGGFVSGKGDMDSDNESDHQGDVEAKATAACRSVSLRANIRETVDPLEFSVQGGEAKAA
jgi:hypothetical protein